MLLLVTSFSVSIDAYIAGLACSLGNKLSIKYVIYVLVCTFVLSIIALFVGGILNRYGLIFKTVGALLFVFLGVKNIYESHQSKTEIETTNALMVGIGVGIDAGVACLSFSLSFYNAFAVAIVMSIFHAAFFVIGQCCAKLLQTVERMSFASGVSFIMLGIYKLF